MTAKTIEFKLKPADAHRIEAIEKQLCRMLRLPDLKDWHYRIERKSLDARKKPIHFNFRVTASKEPLPSLPQFNYGEGDFKSTCIIVGFGPAGMFAALQCLEDGIKPIVIERGKKVRERRRDLVQIYREREVDEDSNYCFGEGGAGTFSDGKLYTRSKKRGDIKQVLQCLVDHGAKESILYEAHPHIGTNKLPGIVERIRETIEANGGEVRFDTRLTDIHMSSGRITGCDTTEGVIEGGGLILATGHSARDIFELLDKKAIQIEAKPFALGVRIEHPQEQIDRIQYKCDDRGEHLPPASYSIVNQAKGRGVFSFCMCPGGVIAPSMTANGEVVVNGWSPSKRNGQFANSGFVVEVRPENWKKYGKDNALAALRFQQDIEQRAFELGGKDLSAPAQRVGDFVRRRVSKTLNETSYQIGVRSVNMEDVLPRFITESMRQGLRHFGKRMRGYDSNDGMLVGVESRTSSPVRIPRDRQTMQHPDVQGLYPCGEGAGYAGGIMSAALDGIACARAMKLAQN